MPISLHVLTCDKGRFFAAEEIISLLWERALQASREGEPEVSKRLEELARALANLKVEE